MSTNSLESNRINETVNYIKNHTDFKPEIGIILGSGLGSLADGIEVIKSFPYSELPNFPVSTVHGHAGKLVLGLLAGKKVIAMQGRFHYYEGYSFQTITYPIRIMKALGIERLFLSNAAGGMNPAFKVGDLMILDDHINLMPGNPLIGPNDDAIGPRFPDMSAPYDQELNKLALAMGNEMGLRIHQGVYAAVTGPTFETRAEYKYIRIIGADAVGMSTVPEVITARHMGLPCFAVSVITDMGGQEEVEQVSHEEVLLVANEAGKKLTELIIKLIKGI